MLVLTRTSGESVQIDAAIQVTVISIGKGRVRLGISAPDHVRIIRSEVKRCRPDVIVTREETCPRQAGRESSAPSSLPET